MRARNCSCTVLGLANLPPCNDTKEVKCQPWAESEEWLKCFTHRKVTSYSLQKRINHPPYVDLNDTSTGIWIAVFTMNKETQQEVLNLTPQDLIGSVGGSLGLFFGFSFSATIFYYSAKVFQ